MLWPTAEIGQEQTENNLTTAKNAMVIVSSAAPIGRWKLWAKWLALMAIVFSAVSIIVQTQGGPNYIFLVVGLIVLAIYRYRPLKQQLDLIIEGSQVRFTLYLDLRCYIWIDQGGYATQSPCRLGKSYGAPVWLTHEFDLNGRRYNLLIYAAKFPSGFMVSNSGRDYDMKVISSSFCF